MMLANAVSAAFPDYDDFARESFGNRTNARLISNENAILFGASDHSHGGTASVIVEINPGVALSLKTPSRNFTNFCILISPLLFAFTARCFHGAKRTTLFQQSLLCDCGKELPVLPQLVVRLWLLE